MNRTALQALTPTGMVLGLIMQTATILTGDAVYMGFASLAWAVAAATASVEAQLRGDPAWR